MALLDVGRAGSGPREARQEAYDVVAIGAGVAGLTTGAAGAQRQERRALHARGERCTLWTPVVCRGWRRGFLGDRHGTSGVW